jgi:hypothetical protein
MAAGCGQGYEKSARAAHILGGSKLTVLPNFAKGMMRHLLQRNKYMEFSFVVVKGPCT